jgi:hypothetical protein
LTAASAAGVFVPRAATPPAIKVRLERRVRAVIGFILH